MNSCLYKGTVVHQRFRPRPHRLRTRLFQFLLDLDELDLLPRRVPLISRNRPNLYSFRDRDHLPLGHSDIRDNLRAFLRSQGLTEEPAKTHLLTNLRVAGYVFNPVSFFYCHRADGSPLCVVAEVHNTQGDLKPYLLRPEDWTGRDFDAERPKDFYISPFSPLDPLLRLRVKMPTATLSVTVESRHLDEENRHFIATLHGSRRPLTTPALLAATLRFPFVTGRVIFLIHWHALLLYLKGNPVHSYRSARSRQRGVLANVPPSAT